MNENKVVEHEEGEIIEDAEFEDISSEDDVIFTEADEASMRKRIEELELRNAELEEIANISGIYSYGTNKILPPEHNEPHQQQHQDAISIIELSDCEECSDYLPKEPVPSAFVDYKQKQHSTNKHYHKSSRKIPSKTISIPSKSRQRHRSKNRRKYNESIENNNYESTKFKRSKNDSKRRQSRSPEIIISKPPSHMKSVITKKRSSSKNHYKPKYKHRKKELLLYERITSSSDSENEEICALNRDELRMAVKGNNSKTIHRGNLQNLVNKKSPLPIENVTEKEILISDDENENVQYDSAKEQEKCSSDSDSLEEQTLRLIALKSAIVTKHLARKKRKEIEEKKPYSPSDFDNWCNKVNIIQSPKDYDEFGNISPTESPINSSDEDENTKAIDMDLANSDSDSPTFDNRHCNWTPIQKVEMPSEVAPPAPPIITPKALRLSPVNKSANVNIENSTKLIISQGNSSPNFSDEEEELALRALLLAKMKSTKNDSKKTILTENSQNKCIDNSQLHSNDLVENQKLENVDKIQFKEDSQNINDDHIDALRNLLLKTNKTESVLKDAVKRLKTSSTISEEDSNMENSCNFIQNNFQISEDKKTNIPLPDSICNNAHINKLDKNIDNEICNLFSENPPLINESNEVNNIPNERINLKNFRKKKRNLRKSRQKLGKCMKTLDIIPKNNLPEAQENFETKTEPSDTENYTESQSCIETLQKIIELNLEKISKIENHTENVILVLSSSSGDENPDISNDISERDVKNESLKIRVASFASEDLINESLNIDKQEKENQNLEIFNKETLTNNTEIQISSTESKLLETCTMPKIENSIILPVKGNSSIEKVDNSLEILKKIESLQKLSESVMQTTEISVKAKASLGPSTPTKTTSTNSVPTNKIIKINKIINQNPTNLKRNNAPAQNVPLTKIRKLSPVPSSSFVTTSEISSIANNSIQNTRLITKVDIPTVKKMIINLGLTSSETESDHDFDDDDYFKTSSLNDNYSDNASPLSCIMESPCYSPNPNSSAHANILSISSPIQVSTIVFDKTNVEDSNGRKNTLKIDKPVKVAKSVVNDVFEAKLNQFLKNARTKVEMDKQIDKQLEPSSPMEARVVKKLSSTTATPLAVRHLPESSQLEYRRLVNRMKILEKQKQTKAQENVLVENLKVTIKNNSTTNVKSDLNSSTKVDVSNISTKLVNNTAAAKFSPNQKESLIRQVLRKGATDSIKPDEIIIDNFKNVILPLDTSVINSNIEDNIENISIESQSNKTSINESPTNSNSTTSEKPLIGKSKVDLFKRYESAYEKTGCQILENIDRSLTYVAIAKQTKFKKLILEEKIRKLREELENHENELKQQNQKISKIYPSIANSHKTIINLKSRRMRLHKAATVLAKSWNTNEYSLNEDKKTEILDKFKHLSVEIKSLKNLNLRDFIENEDLKSSKVDKNLEETSEAEIEKLPGDNVHLEVNKKTDEQNINACSTKDCNMKITEILPESDIRVNQQRNSQLNESKKNENCLENNLSSLNVDGNNITTKIMENHLEISKDRDFISSLVTSNEETVKRCLNSPNIKVNSLNIQEIISSNKKNILKLPEQEVKKLLEQKSLENPNNGDQISQTEMNQKAVDDPPEIDSVLKENKISQYVSPLDFRNQRQKHESVMADPNGILCPFQLMGQCDDKDCKYEHFPAKDSHQIK